MLISKFLKHIKAKGLSDNTILKYRTNLELFVDQQSKELLNVTYSDILDYISTLQDKGYKKTTINNKIITLKEFYTFMFNLNKIKQNPTDNISTLKIKEENTNFKRTIDEQKIKEVLDYLKHDHYTTNHLRDYLIFKIFTTLGLRLMELVNIKISDIDFNNNTLTILRKGGEKQTLPITQEISNITTRYIEQERRETDLPYLFISSRGNHINKRTVQSLVKKILVQFVDNSDLCHTHQLRHYAASTLLRKGANTNIVKEILNHKNLKTTQLYLHNDESDVRNAIESV